MANNTAISEIFGTGPPAGPTESLATQSDQSAECSAGTPCSSSCLEMPLNLAENFDDSKLETCTTVNRRQQNQKRPGDEGKENDSTNKVARSVAFTVSVGDASRQKLPPKKLCSHAHRRQPPTVSSKSIQEKLERADVRRKQLEDARLRRIHSRQEAARKLAHDVEILLQQRALASGNVTSGETTTRMSSRELLATAHQVAASFNTLTHQMKNDLTVHNRTSKAGPAQNPPAPHRQCTNKGSCDRNHNASSAAATADTASPSSAKRSVAFTVAMQESTRVAQNFPKLESPKKPKGQRPATQTKEDIEEKLRKAEERRNTRIQRRVENVIANRESMFTFASKLDKLLTLQDADSVSSRKEAAKLADEIADTFEQMSHNCERVLERAEGFPCQTMFMCGTQIERH